VFDPNDDVSNFSLPEECFERARRSSRLALAPEPPQKTTLTLLFFFEVLLPQKLLLLNDPIVVAAARCCCCEMMPCMRVCFEIFYVACEERRRMKRFL